MLVRQEELSPGFDVSEQPDLEMWNVGVEIILLIVSLAPDVWDLCGTRTGITKQQSLHENQSTYSASRLEITRKRVKPR